MDKEIIDALKEYLDKQSIRKPLEKLLDNVNIQRYISEEDWQSAILYAHENYGYGFTDSWCSAWLSSKVLIDFIVTSLEDDQDYVNNLVSDMYTNYSKLSLDQIVDITEHIAPLITELTIGETCVRSAISVNSITRLKNLESLTVNSDKTALSSMYQGTLVELKEIDIAKAPTSWVNILLNCPNCSKVDLPNTLQMIPSYLFSGNKALKKINIPLSVNKIGINAFYDCSDDLVININKKADISVPESDLEYLKKHINWK